MSCYADTSFLFSYYASDSNLITFDLRQAALANRLGLRVAVL